MNSKLKESLKFIPIVNSMDWVFLSKLRSIKKKLTKSGQINIAETVVSATIILVLDVSVANLGS